MNFETRFSQRATAGKSSAIREILKVTARPEVISFAGGLPADASFPVDAIQQAFSQVLRDTPQAALQYSTTDGYAPLREWVAARQSTSATTIKPEQVIIVSGSQQALDLIGKTFINEGDKVLVETPTYLGALQAFQLFAPTFVPLASDEYGLDAAQITAAQFADAKLLYTLPNFQNPTGRLMNEARRQILVTAAEQHNLLVVEDDPYGELWYDKAPPPSLLSRLPEQVIHLGSFSKILAPGLRLGYIIAPEPIARKIEQIKQATDLHTSTIAQRAVYEVVKDGFLNTHLPRVRALYQQQSQTMLDALQLFMPETVSWNRPAGGMFLWLELPQYADSEAMLPKTLAQNVAYVPGSTFYASNPEQHTLRLAFVTVPEEKIRAGIETLGKVFSEQFK